MFRKDVKSFTEVMETCGNPFLSASHDLIALDTQDIMEREVADHHCSQSWYSPTCCLCRAATWQGHQACIRYDPFRQIYWHFLIDLTQKPSTKQIMGFTSKTWCSSHNCSFPLSPGLMHTWQNSSGSKIKGSTQHFDRGVYAVVQSQTFLNVWRWKNTHVAAARDTTVVVLDGAVILR